MLRIIPLGKFIKLEVGTLAMVAVLFCYFVFKTFNTKFNVFMKYFVSEFTNRF